VGVDVAHKPRRPCTPWTDQERSIVSECLDASKAIKGGVAVKERRVLYRATLKRLPGRTMEDLHNALNGERRRRNKLCVAGCGQPQPADRKTCHSCLTKQLEDRDAAIAQGLCVACRASLDQEGSSSTKCPRCIGKQRNHYNKHFSKTRRTNGPKVPETRRLARWPSTGLIHYLTTRVVPSNVPIVDVFAGMGGLSHRLAMAGRHPTVLNDLHRGAAQALWAALEHPQGLRLALNAPTAPRHLEHAVAAIQDASRAKDRVATVNIMHFHRALKPHHPRVTRLDASLASSWDTWKSMAPNAVYVLDPPWPGGFPRSTPALELTDEQYERMISLVLESDRPFVATLGTSRKAIEILRAARSYSNDVRVGLRPIYGGIKESVMARGVPTPDLQPLPGERDV
jgi:hypothetical protein